MRCLGLVALLVVSQTFACTCVAKDGGPVFAKAFKATLIFELPPDGSSYLQVYLHLVNKWDSDVTWVCNPIQEIDAELLDEKGNPVPQPPSAASVLSNPVSYLVPYGSRMDWLISHGGISGVGDFEKNYAVEVGGKLWLVPKSRAGSFFLRVRLNGTPWLRSADDPYAFNRKLLLDLPPQKIVISQRPI